MWFYTTKKEDQRPREICYPHGVIWDSFPSCKLVDNCGTENAAKYNHSDAVWTATTNHPMLWKEMNFPSASSSTLATSKNIANIASPNSQNLKSDE